MNLEQRALDRITREFPPPEQALIVELLGAYSGPERERVIDFGKPSCGFGERVAP